MKVRDSGMPEEAYWETLFDVPRVLDLLRVDSTVRDVVEVGCGYGTFTLPVARRIAGTLHAFDIDIGMVDRTRERTLQAGLRNVRVRHRDVVGEGFDLPQREFDAVLLFNILHADDPEVMLRSAAELLRPGGSVLAIHWRSDVVTPRGPALSIRPKPEQILGWAETSGLLDASSPAVNLPPWHFGLRLQRSLS